MAKLSAKYEVLYIIDPAQGEEGIAALVEKFKGIVEAHGTLTSVDEWGKRRLAYPINDLVEGYYVYMTCEVTPEMPRKESKYPQLDVDEQFIQTNTHFPGKYIRKVWNIFSVIHEK